MLNKSTYQYLGYLEIDAIVGGNMLKMGKYILNEISIDRSEISIRWNLTFLVSILKRFI